MWRANAAEAVRQAGAWKPDFVLMDGYGVRCVLPKLVLSDVVIEHLREAFGARGDPSVRFEVAARGVAVTAWRRTGTSHAARGCAASPCRARYSGLGQSAALRQ